MNVLDKMAADIEAAAKQAKQEETTGAEQIRDMIDSAVSQAKTEMAQQLADVKAKNEALTAELAKLRETVPGGSGQDTPNGDGGKQDA